MISSGQKIGILGGGQLGTFFTIAAKQLGCRVTVWDPDPEAPARAWADCAIEGNFDDPKAYRKFIGDNDAVTYEWENIPVDLVEAIASEISVHPGSEVLHLLQNRINEKTFLSKHTFPVSPYISVLKKEDLVPAAVALGFPVICKTATAGYDGLGQWRLNKREDVTGLTEKLAPRKPGWIVEKVAPFLKELSIIVARNTAGDVVCYPVTENRHEGGILRLCQVPSEISPLLARRISSLAKDVLTAICGIGVFCIELFLLEEEALLVNEIAPRPHNSGHYSLDVCTASQYEQQVRALCNLPLEKPCLLSPAVMVNVLGPEIIALQKNDLVKSLLSIPGTKVYDYRKQVIKKRRKMGHITLVGADRDQLLVRAEKVRAILNQGAACHGKV